MSIDYSKFYFYEVNYPKSYLVQYHEVQNSLVKKESKDKSFIPKNDLHYWVVNLKNKVQISSPF